MRDRCAAVGRGVSSICRTGVIAVEAAVGKGRVMLFGPEILGARTAARHVQVPVQCDLSIKVGTASPRSPSRRRSRGPRCPAPLRRGAPDGAPSVSGRHAGLYPGTREDAVTRLLTLIAIAGLSIGVTAVGLTIAQEPVDGAINAKIRDEALNRSQVYAMFNHLVDAIGPRLTASPEHKRAAEWARDVNRSAWTLQRARVEPFGVSRGGAWTVSRSRWSSRATCRSSGIRRPGARRRKAK